MNYLKNQIYQRILAKKARLDSHRPLSNAIVRKLHENLEINYTYNTNAIEGNTLTLQETNNK